MERLLTSKQVKTPKRAVAAIDKSVSEWTARRAFRRIGLISAVKQKITELSEKMWRVIINFARNTKIVDDWKRVTWSDETKINRFQSDGKEYYWHRPYERLKKMPSKRNNKTWGRKFYGVGLFYLVESRCLVKKEEYLRILECNIPDFVEECRNYISTRCRSEVYGSIQLKICGLC